MTGYGQVALEMTQWAIFRELGWLWVTMLLSAQRRGGFRESIVRGKTTSWRNRVYKKSGSLVDSRG